MSQRRVSSVAGTVRFLPPRACISVTVSEGDQQRFTACRRVLARADPAGSALGLVRLISVVLAGGGATRVDTMLPRGVVASFGLA